MSTCTCCAGPPRSRPISRAASVAAAMLTWAAVPTANDEGSAGSSPVSVTASRAAGEPPCPIHNDCRAAFGFMRTPWAPGAPRVLPARVRKPSETLAVTKIAILPPISRPARWSRGKAPRARCENPLMTPTTIRYNDLVESVAAALQYISYYHPTDYIAHLARAYEREQSPAAKDAIAQILTNSKMSATGQRPICQDTGI